MGWLGLRVPTSDDSLTDTARSVLLDGTEPQLVLIDLIPFLDGTECGSYKEGGSYATLSEETYAQ